MAITEEMIISGFISKIVSDIVDIPENPIKDSIRNADKKKRDKNQTIETRIYQVTIDAIKEFTKRKYKGQDVLYDAAESIIIGFKNSNNSVETVRAGLKMLGLQVTSDTCEDFLKTLQHEICMDENDILYKEISMIQWKQTHVNFEKIVQNQEEESEIIFDVKEDVRYIKEILKNEEIIEKRFDGKKHIQSRTKEYANKWNDNMFLNDFDKRDEHAGINVKLSEVYLEEHLPHYIWKDNEKESKDLKSLLSEYINEKSNNQMLFVMGQPGIGKSTLITWITANFISSIDNILIYKFATDLKDIDWIDNGYEFHMFNKMLTELNLSIDELSGKTMILDGFDEISIENDRTEVLNRIYWQVVKSEFISNFSLIITCRENYVSNLDELACNYITLQSWDEIQINSFCNIFQEKTKNNISVDTREKLVIDREIFGIPLVLYMVLALNISIDREGSIVGVYDKIFSIEGGIYDRCIDNRRFADNHRISQIKSQIHQISREIAMWIFENNPNNASIPKDIYLKICNDVMIKELKEDNNMEYDFLIGNYFKLVKHCEGIETEEIYFVHRSIYEYFVVETIYNAIENSMLELSEESKEDLAGCGAIYLKQGEITETIGYYFLIKIIKLYDDKLTLKKRMSFYQWWEGAVDKMIENGMLYYSNFSYKNVIEKEITCFSNFVILLKLLKVFDDSNICYILKNSDRNALRRYVKCYYIECENRGKIAELNNLFLGNLQLNNTNLREADLHESVLKNANMEGTILTNADLQSVDLSKANLRSANLSGVNLSNSNLSRCCLNKAILSSAVLQGANLNKADLLWTILKDSNLQEIDLQEADLRGANLIRADLRKANLYKANLENAILREANLEGINLEEANLKNLDIEDSIWSESEFQSMFAELRNTKFEHLVIRGNGIKKRVYRNELFIDS